MILIKKIAEILDFGKDHLAISKNIKSGDLIKFGSYYQNDPNKKEPIEWIVLDKENDQALLISKYGLDAKPYHNIFEEASWEKSFLRQWCNGYFLETAFDDNERKLIVERMNQNNDPIYLAKKIKKKKYLENDTKDQIFLLSNDEYKQYVYQKPNSLCNATKFAFDNGAFIYNGPYSEKGYCEWWLRSHTGPSGRSGGWFVSGQCAFNSFSSGLEDSFNLAVRPSCVIKLS